MSVGPGKIANRDWHSPINKFHRKKRQDIQRHRSGLFCCQQGRSTCACAAHFCPFKKNLQGQEQQILVCHHVDDKHPNPKEAVLLDQAIPQDSGAAQPACRLRPRAPGAGGCAECSWPVPGAHPPPPATRHRCRSLSHPQCRCGDPPRRCCRGAPAAAASARPPARASLWALTASCARCLAPMRLQGAGFVTFASGGRNTSATLFSNRSCNGCGFRLKRPKVTDFL